ncbi:MAG: radical SAM protein [Clostridium sp.]
MLTNLMRIAVTRSLKPFVFQGKYKNKLNIDGLNEIGLYVHIPFCESICPFCPYCKVAYNEKVALEYKDALIKEINIVGKSFNGKKATTSLYFGGGTPTLMIDHIEEIINELKKYFIITGDIGLEVHPRDVNKDITYKLKKAGVNMVSLGVQSFSNKCLDSLGRDRGDSLNALKLISKEGFDVVDVDLIFAIPGQDEKDLLEDINIAFSNGATQISTYPFIDFTFANNKNKPLSEGEKKKMLNAIVTNCMESGYKRTSVWTFGKNGIRKYSSITRDNFIGFGVSATTLLKDMFKINTFSIDGYINRVNNNNMPTALTLDFTLRQRAAYYLFWSCYSMDIDPKKYENIIGKSLEKMFGLELLICRGLGLIKKENSIYRVTNRGAYYYHFIEQEYTTAYIDKMWSIASKTPFPKEIKLK